MCDGFHLLAPVGRRAIILINLAGGFSKLSSRSPMLSMHPRKLFFEVCEVFVDRFHCRCLNRGIRTA